MSRGTNIQCLTFLYELIQLKINHATLIIQPDVFMVAAFNTHTLMSLFTTGGIT